MHYFDRLGFDKLALLDPELHEKGEQVSITVHWHLGKMPRLAAWFGSLQTTAGLLVANVWTLALPPLSKARVTN